MTSSNVWPRHAHGVRRLIAVAAIVSLSAAGSALAASPQDADVARAHHAPPPQAWRHAGAFAAPSAEHRPKIRWWWASPLDDAQTAEELHAIADAGFGGVEIAFNGDAWGTETQRKALATALKVGRDRGLAVDMTMGAVWPVTTPNTGGDPSSPYHAQELMYGATTITGPGEVVVPVPEPNDGRPGTKLIAVTAGRVAEEGTPVGTTTAQPPYQPMAPTAPTQSTVLDTSTLVDVTDSVDDNGMVHLSLDEPGRWVVFAFWQRPTEQATMDHLSAKAARVVTRYLDKHQIGTENADLLIPGSHFFEDSLELNYAGVPWTGSLAETFEQRWGYDLARFLPALFIQNQYRVPGHDPTRMPNPDYDLTGAAGPRVRKDFGRTLDELYVDNHLLVFHRWAQQYGMKLRAQVGYGSAYDMTYAARELTTAGGIADVESRNAGDPSVPADSNWHFAMDLYRGMAGGAHLGGQTTVSTELGATNGREFMTSLSDYKALMDKEWAAGITTPIIHGYAYTPPGTAWPARKQFGGLVAQSWNHQFFPEWDFWPALTDYWTRGAYVLGQGRPRHDVAIYRDAPTTFQSNLSDIAASPYHHQVESQLPVPVLTDDEGARQTERKLRVHHPTPFFDTQTLEQRGYTLQYVDPEGLAGAVRGRGFRAYQALVIEAAAMPPAAARAAARAARAGVAVVVVGEPPSTTSSLGNRPAEDAAVARAMQKVVAAPNARVVPAQDDVVHALRVLRVKPRLSWSGSQPVYSQQRRTADTDYWYLWNAGTETVSFTAEFTTSGVPFTLDLWSGDVVPISHYVRRGARLATPITLRSGQTAVYAFDRSAGPALHVVDTDADSTKLSGRSLTIADFEGGQKTVTMSDGAVKTLTVPQPPEPIAAEQWHLHVAAVGPDGETEHEMELAQLQDWRDIPELSSASGVGTYTTTVTLPKTWDSASRGAMLDVGSIAGTVRVSVNGQAVTAAGTTDTRYDQVRPHVAPVIGPVDVTPWLRPGRNKLRVVLATTLKNAAVGEARSGNTNVAEQLALSATQPYGLLGPVRLVPYSRKTLLLDR